MILKTDAVLDIMNSVAEAIFYKQTTPRLESLMSLCQSHEDLRTLTKELLAELRTVADENKDLLTRAQGAVD